ncbi:MAG: hypothetical protein RM368_16345 [Nostoc sp. DedSLP03]|nr:hypothetical protein [Nostoc sp. DedSLP03]MDZ7966522.1 hypothetical protein [Nostoc sp. DedSLP03]
MTQAFRLFVSAILTSTIATQLDRHIWFARGGSFQSENIKMLII